MAGGQPQGTQRVEGRVGLATIVMGLAMLNKPNALILLLNFMGLKYLSISEGVFYEHGGGSHMLWLLGAAIATGELGWKLKQRTRLCCSEGASEAEQWPLGIARINCTLWGSTSPGGTAAYDVLGR